MKLCKYLLPCGRCDKFDTYCHVTYEDIKTYNRVQTKECDHHWVYQGKDTADKKYYLCCKCGEHRAY